MAKYRLTHSAQADIVSILAWSHERFGEEARKRYEVLIATAIRDAAERSDEIVQTARPELGDGVFSWHLAQSRTRSPGGTVHRPRHLLICRRDGDILVVGRVVHDAMELRRHLVLHRVRDRVEPGKVSAYATLALRRQLERGGLDDLIGELVEVNGPLAADAVAQYVDEWR